MVFIKPKKLQKGDTIAVVSPSWGGPSVFPHIYEKGTENLKKLGFKVKEFPSARKKPDFLYKNPEFRANDINNAFADPEIKAIIASIGGSDSIRILPFLNPKTIKKNPKIILGYSDTTTLNTYLNQLGIVTLNGPSVMAGFSQWTAFEKNFHAHIEQILFENPQSYEFKPFKFYCNGYPDWKNKKNTGKTNKMISNNGWNWLQGTLTVKGELFGGCLEVLESLNGTPFWPEKSFWKNRVLFLETSEEKPSPEKVKRILRNYGLQGILEKISALLFGRARDYSEKEKQELNQAVTQVMQAEFGIASTPVISNMDFGHTDPQWILPLGIKAEINCSEKTFKLTEKIFKE